MDTKEFTELKAKISQEKERKSRLEGQMEQLTKQMHDDFDCKTLDDLETKIEALREEKAALEQEFETGMQELRVLMGAV